MQGEGPETRVSSRPGKQGFPGLDSAFRGGRERYLGAITMVIMRPSVRGNC